MQPLTISEENYLKAVFHLYTPGEGIGTNSIAQHLNTKPASVTEMLKKLAEKKLLTYEKYQGVIPTRKGFSVALNIVRKHRLWEYFLVEKLKLKWDEVHEIAEQLEHIRSEILVEQLDHYLGFPKLDPHGDPIPDKEGKMCTMNCCCMSEIKPNSNAKISGVKNHTPAFLKHLEKMKLTIGKTVKIMERNDFDQSVDLVLNDKKIHISREVAQNLLVEKVK
jgi:DtxR family Mn-dependent transcriptional regulator